LLKTLPIRRPLVEVSFIQLLLLLFFIYFLFFYFLTIGLATMKENKGKGVASDTEGEEDVYVQDDVIVLVV